jgi:hypothetical protein
MYPALISLKLKLMTILHMHLILVRCDRRMFSELGENFEVDNNVIVGLEWILSVGGGGR